MCTLEKRGNIYILTLTGDGEHRLNPTLFGSLRSAFSQIRSDPNPSALVTAATGKFFSNGLDIDRASSGLEKTGQVRAAGRGFGSLVADLVELPVPTIAAVTGHAAAGGMVFALGHDYVLMRRERGFLYMSELDIDVPVPEWAVAVLRSKIKSPAALRDVVLAAKKMNAEAAFEMGIVDAVYEGAEATVEAAVKLGEELVKRRWNGQVYAQIRKVLHADLFRAVGFDETVEDSNNGMKYGSRL